MSLCGVRCVLFLRAYRYLAPKCAVRFIKMEKFTRSHSIRESHFEPHNVSCENFIEQQFYNSKRQLIHMHQNENVYTKSIHRPNKKCAYANNTHHMPSQSLNVNKLEFVYIYTCVFLFSLLARSFSRSFAFVVGFWLINKQVKWKW